MNAEFWRLPGPAGFIEGVHRDLANNCNVVARLTGTTPEGLRYKLQDKVEESYLTWNPIYSAPELYDAPARWLAGQCGEKLLAGASAVDFHALPGAAGKTFVLELPDDSGLLRLWGDFLERFAQASRASENMLAPRFLLFWPFSGNHLPVSDLRLKLHLWEGTLDGTDLHLYAALITRKLAYSHFQRNLVTALAAKLSGGDPLLCRSLCDCVLPDLVSPEEVLRRYAAERGWTEHSVPSGAEGSLVCMEGIERVHPALLAVKGASGDLAALVWSAQVGVLLPLLEERRQEIADRMKDRLYIPLNLPLWQAVTDTRELEIGIIRHQLFNHQAFLPRNLKDQVNRLWKIRGDLSHRKSLSAAYLAEEGTIRALTKIA